MYAVLPNQIEVVGISLGVVGVLLSANRLIRIPGNLWAGALNDRLGRRRLFLLGLGLGIASTLTYGFARGFWPLLGGRLLWGAAWALINVGGYTMILDVSTPADRGRLTGLYQMAFMLGLAFSPLLGGALTDALGFRPAIRICAAVSSVGLALAWLYLPETKPDGMEAAPAGPDAATGVGALLPQDRRILRLQAIYLVSMLASSGVLMPTISLYVGEQMDAAVRVGGLSIGVSLLAGSMLTLRALVGMLAGPVGGRTSDRLPSRWPVVRGALLVGAAGFLVLALPAALWIIPAGVVLVSASAAALAAAMAALVGDLADSTRPGAAMGGLATAGDIGSATGPLVAYALVAVMDLRWVYLLCAAGLVLTVSATWGSAGLYRPGPPDA
jgi:MFS family permease